MKETKINMLLYKLELFNMNKGESIRQMYTWFSNIVNAIGCLGKIVKEKEQVAKILRS